jgi:two-component system, NarL family, response regulator NreC
MPQARGLQTSHLLSQQPVDVMLVDSRAVMREGLRATIEQEPDLVVVAQAASVRDARSRDITPHVIVTDIDLPDARFGDVIGGLREFYPQSPILVFTSIDDPAEVQSVLNAGANGYLLETADPPDLLAAIRAVAAGKSYLQPSLGVELARSHRTPDTALGLSAQEEQVLRLLVLGHTNTDIAHLCNISLRTAETHRAHIQRKLDRHTRAELVQYAQETGLIHLDPQ